MEGERKWRKEKNIERKRTGDEKDDESPHTQRERERCVDEGSMHLSPIFFFYTACVSHIVFLSFCSLFFISLSCALSLMRE